MASPGLFSIQKRPAFFSLVLVAVAILVFSGMGTAQTKSKLPAIEIFGGYSHLSFQSGGLGLADHTQMNGWHGAVSLPELYKGLGVTAEVSGDYAREIEQFNYMIGPQYSWDFKNLRFTGHGMYGRAQTRVRLPGSTFREPSDRHRAVGFGGEFDFEAGSRILIRIVQADYLVTSAFGGTQDNVRISTGLIFRFGKH